MSSHKTSKNLILLSIGLAYSTVSQANSLMIDNFSDYQYMVDTGGDNIATADGPVTLSGTDLNNATRTLIAQASGSGFHETAIETGGLLSISNTSQSAGTASIVWHFNLTDFTQYGNAILLQVLNIDISGVEVEMVANGSSSSPAQAINGAGDLFISFNQFDHASVFSGMTQFELNFSGPVGWDGSFNLIATTTPVPLPSPLALMSFALLGLSILRKHTKLFAANVDRLTA